VDIISADAPAAARLLHLLRGSVQLAAALLLEEPVTVQASLCLLCDVSGVISNHQSGYVIPSYSKMTSSSHKSRTLNLVQVNPTTSEAALVIMEG
jgi:hypothetical protein